MNIIDMIQGLEKAGFTRKQAGTQVQMMEDFKKGLATTQDTYLLKQDIDLLRAEMNLKFQAIDKKFELIDKRFDIVDKKFEFIDQKFILIIDHLKMQDLNMKSMPIRTAMYFAGIMGVVKYAPMLIEWVFNWKH